MDELEKELIKFITADKQMKHPTIVLFMLRNESNYLGFKNLMQTYKMPS